MKFFYWVLVSSSYLSIGQNLVPNPGFEEYEKCPSGYLTQGQVLKLPGWHSPTRGTPDYFNTCSKWRSHPADNWAGISRDFSGEGFVGIIAFMNGLDYREYIGAEFLQPMDSGVVYHLQFSFRLASYARISSGKLGLAVTKNKVSVLHDGQLDLKPAMLAMPDSGIVATTGLWQTVSADYTATGGEKFLYIGNFFSRAQTPFYKIKFAGNHEPMLYNASFYYLDDVLVQPQIVIPEVPIVATFEEDIFETDSVLALKNVQFAYNSSKLAPSSFEELNKVVHFLSIKNPKANMEIAGHTDDQGSDSYNLQLSQKRAEAVMAYLITQGIDYKRLTAVGYGKSEPLINSTEAFARSVNRRVEVRLK